MCLGRLAVAEDSLTLAQKILSCVARCGEKFGADHITKVLTGSSEARVLKFGHDKLSTWGLMKEYPRLADPRLDQSIVGPTVFGGRVAAWAD